MEAQLLHPSTDQIGEAATWLEALQLFLWVDIDSKLLHIYDPLTQKVEDRVFAEKITSILPHQGRKVILTMKGALVSYDLDSQELIELLPIAQDQPLLRPNDGKCSPDGRLFFGVMHAHDYDGTGALYRVDADLSISKVLAQQSIPNGLCWSRDGSKLYYVDSGRGVIEEYDYHPEDGSISYNRVAVHVPAKLGVPDGMTIDEHDHLWVAHWGGYGVYVWSTQSGELLRVIKVAAPKVASCTFGDKQRLYITTARAGMSEEELRLYPQSGALFVAKIDGLEAGINHYPFVQS